MSKTVEKIVINSEGIDVVSKENEVNSIIQLNLTPKENEIVDILDKYNLSSIINYPIDFRIVRALSENQEQLREYLDICKIASNSSKKIDCNNIPDIKYDLRDLKNSNLDIKQQIELYSSAKNMMNIFKKARGKVRLNINVFDKAYFTVQRLLQNREHVKTLTAANVNNINKRKNEFLNNIKVEDIVMPKNMNMENITSPVKETERVD